MSYSCWLVFLMGIAGIWKAIPVGFILRLDPVLIAALTVLGATVGILAIYLLGSRVKAYMVVRMKKKKSLRSRSERFQRLLDSYGPAGLGVLGSLIFGPNATIALGLVLVGSERKLVLWTLAGTVIWTSVLTAATAFGLYSITGA